MNAVLRALPLALGSLFAVPVTVARAQSESLPPIFAPKPPAPVSVDRNRPRAARAPISERLRQAMTEQILATAKVFEAPASDTAALAVSSEGALLMQRFVVKALLPQREEVEVPLQPLLKFEKQDKWWVNDHLQAAHTATLWRFLGGQGSLILSVVNGVGKGVDHQRDFTRVELGFVFRW